MDELNTNVGAVELDESIIEDFIKSNFETQRKKYKVIYPIELETNSYCGKLYGYNRSDNGVFVILGYEGNVPNDALHTVKIGTIGENAQENELKGIRENDCLKFVFISDGEEIELPNE